MGGMILRNNKKNVQRLSPIHTTTRKTIRKVQTAPSKKKINKKNVKIVQQLEHTVNEEVSEKEEVIISEAKRETVKEKISEKYDQEMLESVEEKDNSMEIFEDEIPEVVNDEIVVAEDEPIIDIGTTIVPLKGRIYTVKERLGHGTFGEAFEVLLCGRSYAMKVLKNKTVENIYNNKYEADLWTKLSLVSSNNISLLKLKETFNIYNYKCFIMEKLECDLYKALKRNDGPFKLEKITKIAQQIFSALSHLNNIGIVHCDIKHENIMFVNSEGPEPEKIKLIDFGCSMFLKDLHEDIGVLVQTPFYRAPEVFLGLPLDSKMDIYSVGLILYELYTNRQLYNGKTEREILSDIAFLFGLPHNYRDGVHFDKYMMFDDAEGCDIFIDQKEISVSLQKMKGLKYMLQFGYNMRNTGRLSPTDKEFHKFLRLLLKSEPKKRINAEDALIQPFITSN